MLYVLTVEPLGELIRKCYEIKGIPIPHSDVTSVSFQHADDITLTLGDAGSVENALKIVNKYCRASNARVNLEKTELLYVGNNSVYTSVGGIRLKRDCLKILGVYLGPDQRLIGTLNWQDLTEVIKRTLKLWELRQLTIFGRVTVVNTLIVSMIWYKLAVVNIPY